MTLPKPRPSEALEMMRQKRRQGTSEPLLSVGIDALAAALRENEDLVTVLRVMSCTCGKRHPTDEVPLDNIAGHHDFSCAFRAAMQPILRGRSA